MIVKKNCLNLCLFIYLLLEAEIGESIVPTR